MAVAEIKPNFDVSSFKQPDFRSLFPLPKGWRVKTISRNDLRIRPDGLGMETGTEENVIILADQVNVRKRKVRVLLIKKGKKFPQQSDNFREELLS